MFRIRYDDIRPLYIPSLSKYPGGLFLPDENREYIEVNEREKRQLMKIRNGNRTVFKEVKEHGKSRIEL